MVAIPFSAAAGFKASFAINKIVHIQCDMSCTGRLPLPSAGVFLYSTNSFYRLCFSDMLSLTYPSPSGGREKKKKPNKKPNKPKAQVFGSPTVFSALSWWKLCCKED